MKKLNPLSVFGRLREVRRGRATAAARRRGRPRARATARREIGPVARPTRWSRVASTGHARCSCGSAAPTRSGCTRRRRPAVPIVALQRRGVPCPTSWRGDLVRVPPGAGLPGREAHRGRSLRELGENGTALAARLPVLLPGGLQMADRVTSRSETASSRWRSSSPASIFRVLTLNQIRLVLRIALASGKTSTASGRDRAARGGRARLRFPHGRAGAARPRAGGRLAVKGRRRLRGHEGDRRGCSALLRGAPVDEVRSGPGPTALLNFDGR